MNSSSIYSMYLQQPQAKNYGPLGNRTAVKAGQNPPSPSRTPPPAGPLHVSALSVSTVYGKPVLASSSSAPSPVPFVQGGGAKAAGDEARDGDARDGPVVPPPSVDSIPRPLSPTKLTPVGGFCLEAESH